MKDAHPLTWDSSASGHVDPGETYADSADREVWEELWIKTRGPLQEVVQLAASEKTDQEFIRVFEGQIKGTPKVHGQEVDAGRFFPLELIDRWIDERPEDFATGFVTCYRAWRERDA